MKIYSIIEMRGFFIYKKAFFYIITYFYIKNNSIFVKKYNIIIKTKQKRENMKEKYENTLVFAATDKQLQSYSTEMDNRYQEQRNRFNKIFYTIVILICTCYFILGGLYIKLWFDYEAYKVNSTKVTNDLIEENADLRSRVINETEMK